MVLLGYGFGITDFLEELLTFSLATFPETFTLAGKVGQSTVQRPLNLCQAWFILVAVHWVDSNFEHYEILLRRNNVDILISCRSWDIISEKRPKSCVHCAKTILVISGPDRWPLYGHMRVRTVFDFFQTPRRYNNPKKGKSWSLMFRLMLGKPIWDLSIYIIFGNVIVFRRNLYCPNPESEPWPCLFNPLWSRRVWKYPQLNCSMNSVHV